MSNLVFDRRGSLPGPGLHAILIGVSGYDHLQFESMAALGASAPAKKFRSIAGKLRQLSGPAKSASDLAKLLVSDSDIWGVKLKTCRLR